MRILIFCIMVTSISAIARPTINPRLCTQKNTNTYKITTVSPSEYFMTVDNSENINLKFCDQTKCIGISHDDLTKRTYTNLANELERNYNNSRIFGAIKVGGSLVGSLATSLVAPIVAPTLYAYADETGDKLQYLSDSTKFFKWIVNPTKCNTTRLQISENNFVLLASTLLSYDTFKRLAGRHNIESELISSTLEHTSETTLSSLLSDDADLFRSLVLKRLDTSGYYY